MEKEWLETLSCVDLDDVRYIDFVAEGRRLAKELTDQGKLDAGDHTAERGTISY